MILDLSRVVSLTSAGLRVILQTYKLLGLDNQDSLDNSEINRQPGAPVISPFLKLIIPPPPVSDVLRIAGFERLMEIHSTLESALTSY
jgi:anti-anti-sigma regulatory factor